MSSGDNTNPVPPSEDQSSSAVPTNYKFRDIRVYSSDEWMAGSTKKYRRVFDRYETTYLRVEFSFFNKKFDEEDWEASIRTKSFFINGSQKNELSNTEEKRKISRDENIVYVRHSWGNATPGGYWRKGNYVWEGYIDEVKVGEAKFYIEDIGQLPPGQNGYIDIQSIRLFEGDFNGATQTDKKYLVQFNQKETRFVFGEVNFTPKISGDFYTEFIFNFHDEDGQMKGGHDYLLYIPPNATGKTFTAYASWGNNAIGNWLPGHYTLEVIFMDDLLATVPFQVGEDVQEGQVQVLTDPDQALKPVHFDDAVNDGKPREEILAESLAELDALTGLTNIKQEVNEMVQLVKYWQETGKDVLHKFSLHSVFTGNPGTGKTTVARLLSKIYQGLGILSKGHLVEVDREGLVAGYIGQTAIKTSEKVQEAMGGILFVDEAYALASERGSPYDFGGEAIATLLKRMEDSRGEFGVIVAGYTKRMYDFIKSNPGLKSRFDKYFVFEDYTPDEMFIIGLSMFRHEGVMPDADAGVHLKKYFTDLYEHRDENFGNARTVRQTVAEAVKNQNLRLAAMAKEDRTPDMISTVLLDDVLEFTWKEDGYGTHRLGFHHD